MIIALLICEMIFFILFMIDYAKLEKKFDELKKENEALKEENETLCNKQPYEIVKIEEKVAEMDNIKQSIITIKFISMEENK